MQRGDHVRHYQPSQIREPRRTDITVTFGSEHRTMINHRPVALLIRGILFAVVSLAAFGARAAEKPNIVFLFADDWGWGAPPSECAIKSWGVGHVIKRPCVTQPHASAEGA